MEYGPLHRRGQYILAHQSQVLKRDLMAEEIRRNFGREFMVYRRTVEQVDECIRGRTPGASIPYEFLVYVPGMAGSSWTAFHSYWDLVVWKGAYGITGLIPERGETVYNKLPSDDRHFHPCTLDDPQPATADPGQEACAWCGHPKRADRGDVLAYSFGTYHLGCMREFVASEIRKSRTHIKRADLLAMDAPPKFVIDYGVLKENVGGFWTDVRPARRDDYRTWPVVVFHYEDAGSRCRVWGVK